MRSRTLLAIVMVSLLFLVACSDDGGDEPTDGATATEQPTEATEEPSETEAEEPAEDATLEVEDADLGEILVDGSGFTAYVFLSDTGKNSTCYDDCETAWPPITVDGDPVAGDGIDEALLGTTERDDGSVQVTYDGHPLYTFASDAAPGDTNGQGVGDVWYVVGPDGAPIEAQAMAASDDGGGYSRY